MAFDTNNSSQQIESRKDFEPTKAGEFKRWEAEIKAAAGALSEFHKQGAATIDKVTNKSTFSSKTRLNLFHANIKTKKAMMFGKLPEIKFARRNNDMEDDEARVAGMILERMLNADIGTPNDQYSTALKHNLLDRLLPGLGVSRVRYEHDKKQEQVAAVYDAMSQQEITPATTRDVVTNERAPIDYVHWKDFLWSPAKVWEDVRWVAFKTRPTKDELTKRFGEKIADNIKLTTTSFDESTTKFAEENNISEDAWKRAEIWEIWSKDDKKVYWWNKAHPSILDVKEDPLGLSGFFPCPPPMLANLTTSACVPIPDFVMVQDLYNQIDTLETRITLITQAVKVVGVYDKANEAVVRLLNEGVENQLIPADNWSELSEKGGLQGAIDWLPIDEIAGTLAKLIERRNDVMGLLYELTGMRDIMSGGKTNNSGAVSATERVLEARFGSVIIQALQDEFAEFATNLIRLRAEIVSKHFQPESLAEQSNIMKGADAQIAPQAIKLIKESKQLVWRLEVKPESVAMVDYAQLKEERTAYMTAVATFLQSAGPLVEMAPEATPVLLEVFKWGLGGFKGANEVEGILDQAIKGIQSRSQEEPEQEEGPSDAQIKAQMQTEKLQAEAQKLQHTLELEKFKVQADAQHAQLEAQIAQMLEQQRADNEKVTEIAQAQLNMQEQTHETDEKIRELSHAASLAPKGNDRGQDS